MTFLNKARPILTNGFGLKLPKYQQKNLQLSCATRNPRLLIQQQPKILLAVTHPLCH